VNKVYLWWPRASGAWIVDPSAYKLERPGLNVGHASLDISLNEGLGKAEYVSWWPVGGVPLIWAHGGFQSFRGDCESEGTTANPRLPDRTVDFGGVDEDKMRAKWHQILATSNYQLIYQNCAASVADILRAGGADLSAEVRYRMGNVILWTPPDIYDVAQLIAQNASKIERLRAQGWKQEDGLGVMLMHMPH
jgi:hypothetical protein